MNIRKKMAEITAALTPVMGKGEASAHARAILEDIKGYTPVQLVMHGDRELLPETEQRIDRIIGRVKAGEPLQYVLGKAYFYGRNFKVTPDVLIPRPETSQLIDLIVKDNAQYVDLRILDVGTGSGCIAICLALNLAFSKVTGIDISEQALEIARENAKDARVQVNNVKCDILNAEPEGKYDLIVSNPPYVMEREKVDMDGRVLDYEPSSALFVPDDNPLIFYKAVTDYAKKNFEMKAPRPSNPGRLYFEINPLCKDELVAWLKANGWDAEAQRDYKGNYRFVICRLAR